MFIYIYINGLTRIAFRKKPAITARKLWKMQSVPIFFLFSILVWAKVENKQSGFLEIWKISKQVMNRNKAAVPTILNGTEVISSSTCKMKFFVLILASNSTLDDKGRISVLWYCLRNHKIYQKAWRYECHWPRKKKKKL